LPAGLVLSRLLQMAGEGKSGLMDEAPLEESE
jgi:hypothetical protein